MPVTALPTQQIYDQNLATYESAVAQTSPLAKKAFLRVQASIDARIATSLDRLNIERAKANLAITATGSDLEDLGASYGVIIVAAEATKLTVTLPADNGTIVETINDFVGNANFVRYYIDEQTTAVDDLNTIPITAKKTGTAGNLNIGDTLTIGTKVPGAETVATVISVNNLGVAKEEQEAYRLRVLERLGEAGGGSNAADHRRWGGVVPGVKAIYPYAGKPEALLASSGVTSYPGERTLFVEVLTNIDADGIAPQSILDDVADSVMTDPITLLGLPALSLTREKLFVESITRNGIYIGIRNLIVNPDLLSTLKETLIVNMTSELLLIKPFIVGIDYEGSRNDTLTDLSMSRLVQDTLNNYGASAEDIGFGFEPGVFLPTYTLSAGQLISLAGINYVTT